MEEELLQILICESIGEQDGINTLAVRFNLRIHGSVVDEIYFNPLLDLAKNHDVTPFFVGGDSSYIGGVEIAQFYNNLPVIGTEKQKGTIIFRINLT